MALIKVFCTECGKAKRVKKQNRSGIYFCDNKCKGKYWRTTNTIRYAYELGEFPEMSLEPPVPYQKRHDDFCRVTPEVQDHIYENRVDSVDYLLNTRNYFVKELTERQYKIQCWKGFANGY